MIWLESWFSKNNLVINTDKTKAILFLLNKPYVMTEPVITFKYMKITYTSQFRFLGINITEWNSYIQFLCVQLNNACYMIKSLKDAAKISIFSKLWFEFLG
jgi:hypothetical protein